MSETITNSLPETALRTADFDYELPQELIAQHPTEKRDASRLMVLNRQTHTVEHRHFSDLTDYLRPGDVLVVNDSKVIAASITDVRSKTFNADNGHQTLFITVEADASFTGNVYKVGPQEVRVGYEYILKTSEFELTGLICALEVTDG